MKTPPNKKNAQAGPPVAKIFQPIRVPVSGESSAARPIPVQWSSADANCQCDICAAERGRSGGPSKRLDVPNLAAKIFWEAAVTSALLEAIGASVSAAEAVTLAERHLKKVRTMADLLLRC